MSQTLVEQFKAGFRRHASGVTIVAASTEAGPVGATVSSVSSVSTQPPMISFSVSRSSRSGPALVGGSQLSIHVLADSQAPLAAAFADRSAPRFTAEQGWTLLPGRPPILDRARARFIGHVVHVVPSGDAWLVLVEVDEVVLDGNATGTATDNATPLLHHDRGYWSLGPPAPDLPQTTAGAGQTRRTPNQTTSGPSTTPAAERAS